MGGPIGILFRAQRWSDHLFWLFSDVGRRERLAVNDRGDAILSPIANRAADLERQAEDESIPDTKTRFRKVGSSNHKAFIAAMAATALPATGINDDQTRRFRNRDKRARQARRGKR